MSPNTHYYDRDLGEVVKRLPQHPDKISGSNAGRKQRNKDQERKVYPRTGLPISRDRRSDYWITAYQSAYYQPKSLGRPMLGNEPVVTISVTCDRQIVEDLGLADISRSAALTYGARSMLQTPNQQTTLWIGALRYYMGRQTYAVSDFCDLLIQNWPELSDKTKVLIKRDLKDKFKRHNQAMQEKSSYRPLGADTDVAQWQRVRELWTKLCG